MRATLRVLASDINSDALPGSGDDTDQDFALVCTNCTLAPGFALVADRPAAEACAPEDVTYPLDTCGTAGFSDPVDMAVSGVPPGLAATFSTDPVPTPGSSSLTLGPTGGLMPGDYALSVDGLSGALSHSLDLGLTLRDAAPSIVTAIAPVDGAGAVAVSPTLQWEAVAQASTYHVEVAADPVFAVLVYQATVALTHYQKKV